MNEELSSKPAMQPPKASPVIVILRCIKFVGIIGLVGTLIAFAADQNWIADLATQLRVQYVLMLFPSLIVFARERRKGLAAAIVAALAINLSWIAPYFSTPDQLAWERQNPSGLTSDTIRVASFNVLRTNVELSETLNELLSEEPDIIFLMEVAPNWKPILERVRDQYPFQKLILRQDYTGVALLSKHEWQTLAVVDTMGANPPLDVRFSKIADQADGFRLIATHPLPPISSTLTASRDSQLKSLASRSTADKPTLLMGDFNLTPWSPRFSDILREGEMTNSALGYGISPTLTPLPTMFGGLMVDHVLVNRKIVVSNHLVKPSSFSDHEMVIVDLKIAAPKQ